MLFWGHNGFWLYYSRLEKGTFHWPAEKEGIYPSQEDNSGGYWMDFPSSKAHREVTARTIG
ncbi:IS66 family insertion sequence element accessory protein TnpB [Bacillus chungangensis]|uniref:IS66 family insertion sequence element accessory protein TnpB n=1 Tax=Bacillus chungangensis TaxID=587633 RepID=UPI003522D7C8